MVGVTVPQRARGFDGHANREVGVLFVDGRDFVSPASTPEAYDDDLIHPSVEGARILGEGIADAISEHRWLLDSSV